MKLNGIKWIQIDAGMCIVEPLQNYLLKLEQRIAMDMAVEFSGVKLIHNLLLMLLDVNILLLMCHVTELVMLKLYVAVYCFS